MNTFKRATKIKKSNKGAVLVEFALSIPFILVLLYFTLDAYNYYYWKNRTKNCTYMIASMIQNVSKNRDNLNADSKKISVEDIKNISNIAMISIPLKSNIFINAVKNSLSLPSEYGRYSFPIPLVCVLYVEGYNTNEAIVLWEIDYQFGHNKCFYSGGEVSPSGISGYICSKNNIIINQKYQANYISPDLKITTGEKKIILTILFIPQDINNPNAVSDKDFFGFYILKPPKFSLPSGNKCGYFKTDLIFTPCPGLFFDTFPKAAVF